ncbi:MAG: O-antigen ligase family protein [Acidimicrobiales bacterium]
MSTLSLPAIPAAATPARDRAVRRRVTVVWVLLFFNVLSYATLPTIVTIPHTIGKLLTQGALVLAILLALTVNRRLLIRPNLFLTLWSVLAAFALMITIRGEVSLGSDFRAFRLIGFVSVLWLLTPWWGRRDLMLFRAYVRCLVAILALVLVGFALSPHNAFASQGRLDGDIWPIPPTQVAHYAAVTAGLIAVLWFCGLIHRKLALTLFIGSTTILVLTHTRTALVATLVGILVAGISLFTRRRRVRKVFFTALLVALIGILMFLPALTTWFDRGQSTQEFTAFTGRTAVWSALVHAPRSEPEILFGFGLSNNSFNGLPIDNSWLALYQDQGLVGDVLCGLIVLVLLVTAAFRPRGPARALALFLLVYCLIASFTETGLGGASSYLLELTVAASLLAPTTPQALLSQA